MLKLKNIIKKYNNKIIFDNINLEFHKKSIIKLTGENGIGKTTLLKILSGYLDFEGEIILNGKEFKVDMENYYNSIKYIPCNPLLYEYLTVDEMVCLINEINYNVDSYTIDNFFELLNLATYRDILIKNLSLGTKQKIQFICNFIVNPKVILMDEPFVNFDRNSLKEVLKLLKEYVDSNSAIVLFATHSEDDMINKIVTHQLNIVDSNTLEYKTI